MSTLDIQSGVGHPIGVYTILNLSGFEAAAVNNSNQTWINNVTNSSGNDHFYPLVKQPVYMVVVLSIIYGAVFLCAVVGNISVLCVVLKNRHFHSATYYLIANLSLADLLMAVICQPITLSVNIFTGWHFGAFMCRAVPYLQGVSVCASVNTLVVIAVDRYVAICHVMRQRNTKRMSKIILFFIWLLALLLMIPWALYYHLEIYINKYQVIDICTMSFPEPRVVNEQAFFLGVIFLMCYALPFTFIVSCYSMIGYRVWHRDAPGITSSRGVIEKSKIRVIKMLVVVVLLFMFSWMPLYVIHLRVLFATRQIDSKEHKLINDVAMPFAQWLGTSNSCMNPLVYCLFSQKIRGRIKAMLCCQKPETRSVYSSRSVNTLNTNAVNASTSTRESILNADPYRNGHSNYGHYSTGRSLYHNRYSRPESQIIRIKRTSNCQSTNV